jgi:hypothetical protein
LEDILAVDNKNESLVIPRVEGSEQEADLDTVMRVAEVQRRSLEVIAKGVWSDEIVATAANN